MAKRRSRKTYRPDRRESPPDRYRPGAGSDLLSYLGLDRRLAHTPFPTVDPLDDLLDAPLLGDGRLFHPDPLEAPRTVSGTPARVRVLPRRSSSATARSDPFLAFRDRLTFRTPDRVALCVRRKQRRQVLHALRRTGRGNRPPRRNAWSNVSCK